MICSSGEKIHIRCYSYSYTIWYKDGVLFTDSKKLFRDDIKINHATELDTGNYSCNGTTRRGYRFTETSEVYIGSKRFIFAIRN